MKRKQREENNAEITEVVSAILKLFYVLVPTKYCVLLDGNLSSTLILLRSLEKVRPEMSFNTSTVNWGKRKN